MGQRIKRAAVTTERLDRRERGAPMGDFRTVHDAMKAADRQGFSTTWLSSHDIDATAIRNSDGASFTLAFACNSDPDDPATRDLLVWT